MNSVDDDQGWVARAFYASCKPDALFVQGVTQHQVHVRCLQCEVRLECLVDALQSEVNFDVWGGLTKRERRAILRHYKGVGDWYGWLREPDNPLAVEIRSPKVPRVLAHIRV